jgi:hypothetical protein
MEKGIQIAIGSVLGDGFLHRLSKRKSTSQLYVSQHDSKLPYLKWLHSELGKNIKMNPIKPKTGYQQHWFMSEPDQRLGYLKRSFYFERRKIIPFNIKELLNNDRSLAVWYMDDGNLDKRSKYHCNSAIATYCFSFRECETLSEVFKENFGIKVSVNKTKMRGKIYPRLYIWSESMDRFVSLVKPFIHPVFNYKVGI